MISQDGKIENEEFKVLKENPNVYLHTTGIFKNLRNFLVETHTVKLLDESIEELNEKLKEKNELKQTKEMQEKSYQEGITIEK